MAEQEGKFGISKVIQQARQPANQASGKPDSQIIRKAGEQLVRQRKERQVNLCVKVPESWRKHWAIQAKIQDITMTDVMVKALTEEFGLPDNQTVR